VALLDDLPPDLPLLLLATAELPTADAAASAAALPSSSRRLLTSPGAAAAAADAAGSSKQQCKQQRQQQDHLEQLGLDPTLAALFPPLGQMCDIQNLVDGLQQQAGLTNMQLQQAGGGSDVLGWVVLGKPGPDERRRMFKVCAGSSGWAVVQLCVECVCGTQSARCGYVHRHSPVLVNISYTCIMRKQVQTTKAPTMYGVCPGLLLAGCV
jgi:hypothetical protein